MSEILSETRCRRAELSNAGEWAAVEILDRAIVDQVGCSECLAKIGETCRTFDVKFPQATRPHYARMRARDRLLARGFVS